MIRGNLDGISDNLVAIIDTEKSTCQRRWWIDRDAYKGSLFYVYTLTLDEVRKNVLALHNSRTSKRTHCIGLNTGNKTFVRWTPRCRVNNIWREHYRILNVSCLVYNINAVLLIPVFKHIVANMEPRNATKYYPITTDCRLASLWLFLGRLPNNCHNPIFVLSYDNKRGRLLFRMHNIISCYELKSLFVDVHSIC